MSKYQEIMNRYESSGLSQKEFGMREGLSAGMVSYYIRKARQEESSSQDSSIFSSIEMVKPVQSVSNIEITTPSGMKITIPVQ